MKKKIVMLLLASTLAFSMVACGGSEESKKEGAKTESTESKEEVKEEEPKEEVKKENKKDLPDGQYSDMGAGTMHIATAGGTSENGNVPTIFVSDEILLQIGLNTSEFDGSKLSYIYVDGMENAKEQLADTQTVIDLSENALKAGKHTVEIVQYENDEPTGTMVTYKKAEYEVKEK